MTEQKGINQLVKDYLADQDVADTTKATYLRTLNIWIKWMVVSNVNIANPTKGDVIRYKVHLKQEGKSPKTQQIYLKIVGLLYNWMVNQRLIDENPTAGLAKIKQGRGYSKGYLNVDQVKMLLDSDPKTLIELRNYAIINLVLRSALRCVEISRINVEDVIRLPIGLSIKIMRKGHQNRDQEIGITQKALSPIDLYLVARGECQPTDPLFANCSRHCINKGLSSSEVSRIISNELKFKKLSSKLITPHSLRHTAAINALKYGADLWDISKLLGHTNITTTQIYLEALTEETYKINPAAKTLDDVY